MTKTLRLLAGLLWIVVTAAVGVGFYFVIGKKLLEAPTDSPATDANRPPVVEVKTPQRATMIRSIDVPATLEAFEQVDVYAKTSGYVREVRADMGDHVKAGDVLAVIDPPEHTQELAEGQAQVEAKAAQRKAAGATIEQMKQMLEIANRQLHKYNVELSFQQETFKRREELFAGKAITDQDLDESRSKLELAKADVGIAEAKVRGAEADITSAESAEQVATAQVLVATVGVLRIKALLDYDRVVAPFGGVIARRSVDRGDLVLGGSGGRGTPLFALRRVDTIRIFLQVPESDAAAVRIGTKARVRPFGLSGEPLTATVTRTAESLNPSSRDMRTEIDVPNPDGRLMPGMYAQAILDLERHENALTVPASSIGSDGKGTFLFVVENGKAVQVPVTTGLEDASRIEVTDGLKENAAVVVAGRAGLKNGIEVKITAKP